GRHRGEPQNLLQARRQFQHNGGNDLMQMNKILGFAAVAALGAGCSGTYLPVVAAPAAFRVPTQQLLIAQAAEQAFSGLSFKEFKGATGYVTVQGVFPHSDNDLGAYIRSSVESKLAEDGVTVKHG